MREDRAFSPMHGLLFLPPGQALRPAIATRTGLKRILERESDTSANLRANAANLQVEVSAVRLLGLAVVAVVHCCILLLGWLLRKLP